MGHLKLKDSDVSNSTPTQVKNLTPLTPWNLGDVALNAVADGDDDRYPGDTRETMPNAIVDLIKTDINAAVEYIELAENDSFTRESLERLIKTDPVIAQIVQSIRAERITKS